MVIRNIKNKEEEKTMRKDDMTRYYLLTSLLVPWLRSPLAGYAQERINGEDASVATVRKWPDRVTDAPRKLSM